MQGAVGSGFWFGSIFGCFEVCSRFDGFFLFYVYLKWVVYGCSELCLVGVNLHVQEKLIFFLSYCLHLEGPIRVRELRGYVSISEQIGLKCIIQWLFN